MELQDPTTNKVIDESTMLSTALNPASVTTTATTKTTTITSTIPPSDDENSSIITVRSNDSNSNSSVLKLHLAVDDDNIPNVDREASPNTGIGSYLTTKHQLQSHHQILDDDNQPLHTIVEVVNPLISGDGYANRIAVGRSADSSLPSFDLNDNGNVADDEYDSFNVHHSSREMSLNDRMKNVLQELIENERVKLSFSKSLTEDDNDSDEDDTDVDGDDNELLHFDDEHDGHEALIIEPNGNDTPLPTPPPSPEDTRTFSNVIDDLLQHVECTDDITNANASSNDDDTIGFQNPNFLSASSELNAAVSTDTKRQTSKRDDELTERLLSELNIDAKRSNLPTEVDLVEQHVNIGARTIDEIDKMHHEDDVESLHDESTTTSTETSIKSTNNSSSGGVGGNKKKKRKGKPKKK